MTSMSFYSVPIVGKSTFTSGNTTTQITRYDLNDVRQHSIPTPGIWALTTSLGSVLGLLTAAGVTSAIALVLALFVGHWRQGSEIDAIDQQYLKKTTSLYDNMLIYQRNDPEFDVEAERRKLEEEKTIVQQQVSLWDCMYDVLTSPWTMALDAIVFLAVACAAGYEMSLSRLMKLQARKDRQVSWHQMSLEVVPEAEWPFFRSRLV